MYYLAKFETEAFDKMKENKNGLPIKFRIAGWIQHLSVLKNFEKFFTKKFFKEQRKKYEEPKTNLNIDQIWLQMDTNNCKRYTIEVDREQWNLFRKYCRMSRMSANYALNELVKAYVDEGDLFVIHIKV